jgi:hypothetical protein
MMNRSQLVACPSFKLLVSRLTGHVKNQLSVLRVTRWGVNPNRTRVSLLGRGRPYRKPP